MTNILIFCTEKIPSAWVGVYEPLLTLQYKGSASVTFKRTLELTKKELEQSDVVICVRGSERLEYKIVKACKDAGKFVCYYLDDDLIDIPSVIDCAEYYKDNNIVQNIIAIIGLCDVFMAPNPKLIAKYSKYNNNGALVKGPATMLDMVQEVMHKKNKAVRIGFAGGVGHANTLETVVKDALIRIDNEYGDKVEFEFVGAKPGFINQLKHVKHTKYMDSPRLYKEYMQKCSWDIALAPLPEGEFFKYKYFNKFLEYGALKVSGIYSNIEPFIYIVENGKNGILCENTEEAWYNAIKKLIEDEELRQGIAEQAFLTLKEGYSLEVVGANMTELVPQLVNYKAPNKKISVRFLNKYYNQMRLWVDKMYRILKQKPIRGIFIIGYLSVRKIFRIIKSRIGG